MDTLHPTSTPPNNVDDLQYEINDPNPQFTSGMTQPQGGHLQLLVQHRVVEKEVLVWSMQRLPLDVLWYLLSFVTSMEDLIYLSLTTNTLYDRVGLYLHMHLLKNSGNPVKDFFVSHGWEWVSNGGSWKSAILAQPEKLRKSVLSLLGTTFIKHLGDIFQSAIIPYGEILLLASEYGSSELVQFAIYNNTLLSIDRDNQAIRLAIQKDHVDIVEMLLACEGVDPAIDDNITIRTACHQGYLNIVKALLGRVDLTCQDNAPFRLACKEGHFEVAKLLFDTAVINPAAQYNYAIRFASQHGRLDVVKLLLACDRVNPADGDNYALIQACKNGHLDVVQLLVSHPNVDPTASNNKAMCFACRFGHAKVVELLLTCNRGVKPTKDARQWAVKNKHVEVQKILEQYSI